MQIPHRFDSSFGSQSPRFLIKGERLGLKDLEEIIPYVYLGMLLTVELYEKHWVLDGTKVSGTLYS